MEENNKKGKSIFSILFLICLFSFAAFNIICRGPELMKELRKVKPDFHEPKQAIAVIEREMSEKLFFRYPLIEGYGALQLIMGKKEENAFSNIKGKDGMLYDASFWNGFGDDQKELAVRTRRLHDLLEEEGTEMGVVLFPMKLPEEQERYYGLPYNDFSKLAGDFASWLRYYKVPVLDLRNICKISGLTHQEAFFKTDHHWTPIAAFSGYCNIINWMEQSFDVSLDPDYKLRDLGNYNQVTFPNYMLGSQGRETGVIFAGGAEDYTVIYPEYQGDYLLWRGDIEDYKEYTGGFEEALLKLDVNEDSLSGIYSGNGETVYLHKGVDNYVSIRNLENGSKKKILLLRDSYATPVGAFLAQSFEQVDMLWTLQLSEEELMDFLTKNHYDYVLLALYPENLKGAAFPFGMEETP
ncbi:hypothetical protein V3C10_08230 [[Clostridium] symbiosum]|uniref:alginate O-acetyltransferase AlgX-related protein n=1 Tax=Clostridium symbiosum TaxID=1512 RepID=UPI001D0604A6|nr:hypothetical protein [[Clostridium] symbiosum]MCB6610827.1 hypothetical protein [[Clostridium] symbiosum]MCB6929077.1 hypothetical protein [[Clostridium] symbiosum]